MQYQVPQFIETEDKIVGPLTLRQFLYVGVAGGISGILYFLIQGVAWIIISVILIGGAIAVAFLKIQGRPFAKVIAAAFSFYWKPQLYIWQPEPAPRPARKAAPAKPAEEGGKRLRAIALGMALHKTWEVVQTGSPPPTDVPKTSDRLFLEKKMEQRYQVFRRLGGDQAAARRVDYR